MTNPYERRNGQNGHDFMAIEGIELKPQSKIRKFAKLAVAFAFCFLALLIVSQHADAVSCAADIDTDGDGIFNAFDNCVEAANPGQADVDGDGFGQKCDPDFNNNFLADAQDRVRLQRAVAGQTPYQALLDMNGNGVIEGDTNDLALFNQYVDGENWLPPGPSCVGGGQIMGSDIIASGGVVQVANLRVTVDPGAFTSGDTLDWSYTALPSSIRGFTPIGPSVSISSSVETSATITTPHDGSSAIYFLHEAPGWLDAVPGDPGPWTAPVPAHQRTPGMARIESLLQALVPRTVVAAKANYVKRIEQVLLGSGEPLEVEWHTLRGQLPDEAAIIMTAIRTQWEANLADSTCPPISPYVRVVHLPVRMISNATYAARMWCKDIGDCAIYFPENTLHTANAEELSELFTHETEHWWQLHVQPKLVNWVNNPAALAILEPTFWPMEAYAARAQIIRYTTHNTWLDAFKPWPDYFDGMYVADGKDGRKFDPNYIYQLGFPLSEMAKSGSIGGDAPTMCEFFTYPGFENWALTGTPNSLMQVLKAQHFAKGWGEFVHKYNTDRESFGMAELGQAPGIPFIDANPRPNLVRHEFCHVNNGQTFYVHLEPDDPELGQISGTYWTVVADNQVYIHLQDRGGQMGGPSGRLIEPHESYAVQYLSSDDYDVTWSSPWRMEPTHRYGAREINYQTVTGTSGPACQ